MPINLTAVMANTKTIQFEYEGQTMPLTYKPATLTAKFLSDLQDGQTANALSEGFCELVTDWDLRNGTKKLDITPENVASLPIQMLRQMIQGIVADGEVGKE